MFAPDNDILAHMSGHNVHSVLCYNADRITKQDIFARCRRDICCWNNTGQGVLSLFSWCEDYVDSLATGFKVLIMAQLNSDP